MNTYCWFVRGEKHAAMCRTSMASVMRADPDAHPVVVTDEASPAWKVDSAVLNIRSGMPIMLANLEAQCTVLSRANSPVTFLDTDTLLLDPLPYTPGADLTITWRDHVRVGEDGEKVEGIASAMPYNYGVLHANPTYGALEAFIWLRERIRKMHPGHQQWYGNQLALFELAGQRPEKDQRIDERRIPWMLTQLGNPIRILKLPGSQWNYTPAKVGERLLGTRSVLHFKGHSRALMESYAKRLELPWQEAA
jgi:hypothetical protein